MSIDNVYYSVVVTRKLLCNCSGYNFPHNPASSDCLSGVPSDLSSIPCRASHTAIKRAKDLISNGYF